MTWNVCIHGYLFLLMAISIDCIQAKDLPAPKMKKDNLRVELITNPRTAHTTVACSFKHRPGQVSLYFRVYSNKAISDTTYIHVRDLKTNRKIDFTNEPCIFEKRKNRNSTFHIIRCFAWVIFRDDYNNYDYLYNGNETKKYKIWLTQDTNPNKNIIWDRREPFDLAQNIFGCAKHPLKKIKFKHEQFNSIQVVWVIWPQTWIFKPELKVSVNG